MPSNIFVHSYRRREGLQQELKLDDIGRRIPAQESFGECEATEIQKFLVKSSGLDTNFAAFKCMWGTTSSSQIQKSRPTRYSKTIREFSKSKSSPTEFYKTKYKSYDFEATRVHYMCKMKYSPFCHNQQKIIAVGEQYYHRTEFPSDPKWQEYLRKNERKFRLIWSKYNWNICNLLFNTSVNRLKAAHSAQAIKSGSDLNSIVFIQNKF